MAGRRTIERKLAKVAKKITKVRAELAISHEQLVELADHASDAETRSIVSEDGNRRRVAADAGRHRDRLSAHVAKQRAELAELEDLQNALLDQFSEATD
jgi:hypothetical protein